MIYTFVSMIKTYILVIKDNFSFHICYRLRFPIEIFIKNRLFYRYMTKLHDKTWQNYMTKHDKILIVVIFYSLLLNLLKSSFKKLKAKTVTLRILQQHRKQTIRVNNNFLLRINLSYEQYVCLRVFNIVNIDVSIQLFTSVS